MRGINSRVLLLVATLAQISKILPIILLIYKPTLWVVGGSTSRIAIVGAFCSKFNFIDGVEFGGSKHDYKSSLRTYISNSEYVGVLLYIQVQSLFNLQEVFLRLTCWAVA